MARKSSPDAANVRLVPSTSAFDFLEGGFAAAQRARKIGLGITMASIVILTLLALSGLGGLLDKNAQTSLLAQAQRENTQAVAELARIANVNGISADRLNSHVSERLAAKKAAVGSEIDAAALIRALRASAPAGVEITSIVFHDSSETVKNAAPIAGADTTPKAGATKPGTQVGTIEIKATMKNFALLGAWGSSVQQIPGLVPGDPMWQSSGGQVNASLNLPVTTDGLTARAKQLTTPKDK